MRCVATRPHAAQTTGAVTIFLAYPLQGLAEGDVVAVGILDAELPGNRVARHQKDIVPLAATASGTTCAAGKRVVSSVAQPSTAFASAHTITVGPEPEIVAPRAPSGRSARTASKSGAFAAR